MYMVYMVYMHSGFSFRTFMKLDLQSSTGITPGVKILLEHPHFTVVSGLVSGTRPSGKVKGGSGK